MSTELKASIDAVARTFEEFKTMNDKKITDTAANLNQAITDLLEEQKAIKLSIAESKLDNVVGEEKEKAAFESKSRKAFKSWMKDGAPGKSFANSDEFKSLITDTKAGYNITTPADGGYGVPTVIQQAVELIIQETSPIQGLTTPVTIGGSTQYIKILDNNDASAGWVSELGIRTTTNANTFTEVTIPTFELYANPQISLQMLEDVQFDAEAELMTSMGDKLARVRNAAFVNGSGSGQPTGFLSVAANSLASSAPAIGSLNTIVGGGTAAIVANDIYNLIYSLRDGYRTNGTFAMHRLVMLQVRTLKDSYGRYMWEPNYQAGQPPSLAGYPVVEFDDMPSVLATTGNPTNAITFADWQKFYRIVNRINLMLLRDPYTVEGSVVFKTRQRVGGNIENGIAGVTLAVPV